MIDELAGENEVFNPCENEAFKPGDTVSLKCNDEEMTVIGVGSKGVRCAFWNRITGKPEGTTVASVALKLVEAA